MPVMRLEQAQAVATWLEIPPADYGLCADGRRVRMQLLGYAQPALVGWLHRALTPDAFAVGPQGWGVRDSAAAAIARVANRRFVKCGISRAVTNIYSDYAPTPSMARDQAQREAIARATTDPDPPKDGRRYLAGRSRR